MTIKIGSYKQETLKVITGEVRLLWAEIIQPPGDFLFYDNLKPWHVPHSE